MEPLEAPVSLLKKECWPLKVSYDSANLRETTQGGRMR